MPRHKNKKEVLAPCRSVLLADEMGLGKTIQVIGYLNATQSDINMVLLIAPAIAKLNWEREFKEWLTRYYTIKVMYSKSKFEGAEIYIMNYDIIKKHTKAISAINWDLLVCDESHYLKNRKTIRTKGVKKLTAKRRICLTGTPIVNKPKDIWPVLNMLDPDEWGAYSKFTARYCAAHMGKWGWDDNGASNLDELQQRLRSSVMIRRKKSEVFKELPPKTRQIIEIKDDASVKKETNFVQKEYGKAVQELTIEDLASFDEMAKVRHDTALAKVPFVVKHLQDIIDTGEKVVCFGWHKDVIHGIADKMKCGVSIITGDTSARMRDEYVKAFNREDGTRLFLGNIKAAGTAIRLKTSNIVVFAELPWTPAELSQAEDRVFWPGQKAAVLVHHIVMRGSIDAFIAKKLIHKQKIIDETLD